jgi:hypothetical protein
VPARRYYGTPRNTPVRPLVDRPGPWRLLARAGLGVAGLLAVAWAADRAWLALTTAEGFAVRSVSIEGARHADPTALLAALDLEGRNVFTLDLEAARARLLAEPWVAEARLRRRLPDRVRVSVVEETPTALERRGADLALLDESGRVLEASVRPGRFALPLLEGAGSPSDRARAALLLTALRERAPRFWERVERLEAGRSDRLVLRADGHPPVWVSGPESVDELERYLRNAAALERRFGPPAHVDARWRDRLYLGRDDGRS